MNTTAEQGLLSIGQVAERTGVTVPTLRYYDELGMVSPAARVGGQRRFAEDVIPRVGFIRTAQRAGFSLDEIGQLLNGSTCSSKDMVTDKVGELRRQREELAGMIQLLEEFARCGCAVLSDCALPVVQDPVHHIRKKE